MCIADVRSVCDSQVLVSSTLSDSDKRLSCCRQCMTKHVHLVVLPWPQFFILFSSKFFILFSSKVDEQITTVFLTALAIEDELYQQ